MLLRTLQSNSQALKYQPILIKAKKKLRIPAPLGSSITRKENNKIKAIVIGILAETESKIKIMDRISLRG